MAKTKYTFIILTKNGNERHFRLYSDFSTINEKLVRDSFNKNAVLAFMESHKIRRYDIKWLEI